MDQPTDQIAQRHVVLAPRDRAEAADRVVARHGWTARIEHTPELAMAELCLALSAARGQTSWCQDRDGPILVLLGAQEMPGADGLLSAVQTYLPEVRVCELVAGRLRSLDNPSGVIDTIPTPPGLHTETVDSDELSMLLDGDEEPSS